MATLLSIVGLLLLSIPVTILFFYALAHVDLFFTLMREGTWAAIMSGESLDHMMLRHLGYYVNDPRRKDEDDPQAFDASKPIWERIKGKDGEFYSSFPPHQPIRRLLERWGIYYYGFWPFKSRYSYTFEWTETKLDDNGKSKPLHRRLRTNFVYSAMFTYWLQLSEAETKDNIPVDLDYWLTVEINNGYKALFNVENWLTRITADANQTSKVWVGESEFEGITTEGATATNRKSHFAQIIHNLNFDLVSDPRTVGAPMILGVTTAGGALQEVKPAGAQGEKLATALSAKMVAEREASAEVARAEGDKKARVIRAEGEKQAINLVYSEIERQPQGLAIRTLEALEKSGQQGGNTVWAPNPLEPLSDALKKVAERLPGTPSTP